jgi:hypothetical protein
MTKELVGHAANIYILEGNDSKPIAMTELVVITSEPLYKSDGASGFARVRELSQFRVSVQAKQLRDLANSLGELANAADELMGRTTITPEDL